MLDNNIIRLIKPKIEAYLLDLYGVTAVFKQGFQPKKVGANTGNVVYYYFIPNHNYGLPKRESYYDSDSQSMLYKETQLLESTLQFNSLVPLDSELTANDLLVYTRNILLYSDFLTYLNDNGLGVYKPTSIRNGWFSTDNDGYENNPSFDVTFQHELVTTSTTNFVSQIEQTLERV